MVSLASMEKYMLTMNNICSLLPQSTSTKVIEKKTLPNIPKKELREKKSNQLHKSNQSHKSTSNSDPLFWIFYCILYGDIRYELDHSFQTEKSVKIKSIEDLRKIKPSLKTFKLRLNEIEDQLLNSKKIEIKALLGLALLHKKNIFYVWDNKFFEFICSEDEIIYIIKNNNNEIASYSDDMTQVQYYKDNYLQIENIDKKLKAVTNYSKEELVIMTQKLQLNVINPKPTKAFLYQCILEKI